MNAIQELYRLGQSIWYDNISRRLITSGELAQKVAEGLAGMTSNPTIFDKAITGGNDYDGQIRELVEQHPRIGAAEIIQALMVRDIQMAADVIAPVFEREKGADGFVSIEVSPEKAHDAKATVEEVKFLWNAINRKNVMVKIPATREGLAAIEQATGEGMNINVTLIFSLERYREVTEAYLRGIERRVKAGKPVDYIRSVASVFVSRVDTLVDDLLNKKIAATNDRAAAERLRALLGKAAVANSKLIYQAFKEIFNSSRFTRLREGGATLQRPLWGSTSTKNPAYKDLKYVETLVGPHTVNTVPPDTYRAILDHMKPALTVEEHLAEGKAALAGLAASGIDLPWVMQKLEDDGVAAFAKSFQALYHSLEEKRDAFAHSAVPTT